MMSAAGRPRSIVAWEGRGAPPLLLRGFPQTHSHWHRLAPLLEGEFSLEVPDRLGRQFTADAPDRTWVADIERHEALLNLVVVRDHRHRPVASGRLKLRW